MSKAPKGRHQEGYATPSTPRPGTSYAPAEFQAWDSVRRVEPTGTPQNTRVSSGAHSGPSAVVTQRHTTGPQGPVPVPSMTFTSPDGVVTRPPGHHERLVRQRRCDRRRALLKWPVFTQTSDGRRFYFDDGVGDPDEDERAIADPDDLDDWTDPETDQQEETQDMTTYSHEEVIALVKKAEAEVEAKMRKSGVAAPQAEPEISVDEAVAQLEALGRDPKAMLTKGPSGETVFDPQFPEKLQEIARKAGADLHLRRGGDRR
jgi:hypothetical protein